MQKILHFEINMAVKDRPKLFQFITIALFSFCVTVIFVSPFLRLATPEKQKQTFKGRNREATFANFVTRSSSHLLDLKK